MTKVYMVEIEGLADAYFTTRQAAQEHIDNHPEAELWRVIEGEIGPVELMMCDRP